MHGESRKAVANVNVGLLLLFLLLVLLLLLAPVLLLPLHCSWFMPPLVFAVGR